MNGKKIAISIIGLSILLGGCSFMGNSDEKEKKADDGTTPVAEYKGQGFIFVDGDKSKDIVEKNEAEIKKRAVAYMKDTYKTNVKVNNVVPARDAAVVMVEAEEPIEFHTSVIVGIDPRTKELNSARSEEWKVEGAIISGSYVKAYREEFGNLDTFTKTMAKKYDLQGLNQTAINKTHASGYEKSYYFVPVGGDSTVVYDAYIKKQNISASELQNLFSKVDGKFENANIVLHFYNTSKGVPKQEKAEQIAKDLKNETGLPKGNYSVILYDNFIVDRVGLPDGDNVRVEDIQK
ncbi:hypothetical protein X560_2597 [Listeria fleischmannii 1991]|uniref:Protein of uncharacterized function (DUF1672) n=2 Tax=Listeria fleischmannii TaxID=1069827 RepID=A0A2X3H7P3_9LIST|nr:DUF1672 family protein [Listeria fleischmannii]EMG27393.1 putative lipoprotein [Listeria fleischmannii subsp. fleischmannii LU2006-1]KMT57899.1 hypothetical protein X560_2597 [Listeria fleischmannii 1991]SQC68451.1 Protein of uncharacterised function (DUF1672) [Listeria fleischmannii subsp. fleischmannii]